jgi:RNA polymerase sigma factor (sigma-70 family)
MSTDSELLDGLLEVHAGMIDRILASYERGPEARLDLRQEVAIALWRTLQRFRGEASHRTLIARIAHNIGAEHVRQIIRRGAIETLDPGHPSETAGPDQVVVRNSLREELLLGLEHLPLSQRQVVSLHLEDFSHAEIAETLGLTEGAVAVRLHRAKETLSRWMKTR